MKILITGGCGFIGGNLIRHLIASTEHSIINVDCLTYAADRSLVRQLDDDERHQFCKIDIADGPALTQVFHDHDPDAVIHLAAESHVDRSIDGPTTFVKTNVNGTFCLLSASLDHFRTLSKQRATQFRFIQVSTDEVYGELGKTGRFTEDTAYQPRSPYSATKAAADHLASAWYVTYGLPTIITHCGNNYGPYQFPEKLLPLVIIKCLSEESLPVFGDGQNVRDWLHVDDHARGLMGVLERGQPGETYNIGGDCERRNIDLVKDVCNLMEEFQPRPRGRYQDLIEFVRDRPGHDFRYAINSKKIQSELNWQPQHSFESGLRETVRWYLNHRDWWQSILSSRYDLERLGNRSQVPQTSPQNPAPHPNADRS